MITSEGIVDSHAPQWAYLVTAIAAILISILGFFGNLLTILALPHARRLRHSATWLVVNLAVAEGAFCVTILPISAAHLLYMYHTDNPLFDDTGCSVFVFLRYVNIQAELLSIAAIAINRCVLIANSKLYPRVFSGPKTAGIIAGIWIFSIAIMLIPLFKVYGQFTYNDNTEECDFDDDTHLGKAPRKVFLILGFMFPCIFIIASYSYIYYKARQSAEKVLARQRSCSSAVSVKSKGQRPAEGLRSRDIRIARTIGVIYVVFLVCCTPVSVAHYLESKMNPAVLLLLHPLYWAQYCINIFVYVFMNKQYRDAYINFISQWWPNFKEVSQRKFHWKEEATSGDSRRQSRAATPNLSVRFKVLKSSNEAQGDQEFHSAPQVSDTCL
ncbi:G-protein coupled receptor moody [Chionoecetes opilio]|uniref:G-protein coupled receptor moody n=1 Tax=Chionoecetes opilio TaxID=41210 RepID=A0A8J5CJQ7_CHIOP|nr:G-protein coupled receptor moody [Chionoecetes opilio]